MRPRIRYPVGALVGLVATGYGATAAADAPGASDDLPAPTADQIERSVQAWDPSRAVQRWGVTRAVEPFERVETAEGRTTITLATDILLTPDRYDLPDHAAARIVELLDEVPDGVDGHTDSRDGAIPNEELSQKRAQTVAEAIVAGRPDLDLRVEGFADSRPAQQEDPADPSPYAANRRVETGYAGGDSTNG